MGKPLWIRHVLVPGWTDQEDHLKTLGGFITTLHVVMEKMTVNTVRHLPILENGELKGILTIGEVVKFLLNHALEEIAQLKDFGQESHLNKESVMSKHELPGKPGTT